MFLPSDDQDLDLFRMPSADDQAHDQPIRLSTEDAAHAVWTAAKLLSRETDDPAEREGFARVARVFKRMFIAPRLGLRTVLSNSPVVIGRDGSTTPIVALVELYGEGDYPAVTLAMDLFLLSDWKLAA